MVYIKNWSLKRKLPLSFFLVTCISIMLTTTFSLIYFFGKLKQEAVGNMKKNIHVAKLIYDSEIDSVKNFCQLIASDKTVQLLVDLDIRNKLSEFIQDVVEREKNYQITVYDENGDKMANVGPEDSILITRNPKNIQVEKDLMDRVLSGEVVAATEVISVDFDINVTSLFVACPIKRNVNVIGVLFVRYVLNDNHTIVGKIKTILGVEADIYQNVIPLCTTGHSYISQEVYRTLMNEEPFNGIADIKYNGRIAEYVVINDYNQRPIGVLGINISADTIVYTFFQAVITFSIIMVACITLAYFLGLFISNGILGPIKTLLAGVNKITSGDLSYEIMINLKDEIGKLSESFNTMRMALNEKIHTIEDMNLNLENTVKDRTKTIESLLNKMRKYLSPQLYESIIGGKTDINTRKHSRKKLTIFFSDIVSFTETTESMEAEDLSYILNVYLDNMAKIALKWGGIIDKFIGDAIMVFFGDPEFISDRHHALQATRMAMEMVEKLQDLRHKWVEKGIERPLHVRIGINTGYCTVGNFGSENRMDYTIIGGNVNLASRLETAAMTDTIHISHETYSLIKDEIECDMVGELPLKGIKNPVKTYKVIKEKAHKARDKYLKVNEHGVLLHNINFAKKDLTDDERRHMVKSLKIALAYSQGKLIPKFSESKKSWQLIQHDSE